MSLLKNRGESEKHFLARKIMFDYLRALYDSEQQFEILPEFPPYKSLARADLAAVDLEPPRMKIMIWVEVQETRLSRRAWNSKLTRVLRLYRINSLWVTVTEDLKEDLEMIWSVLSNIGKCFVLFCVDTSAKRVFKVRISRQMLERTELLIRDRTVFEKECIPVSLTNFMR